MYPIIEVAMVRRVCSTYTRCNERTFPFPHRYSSNGGTTFTEQNGMVQQMWTAIACTPDGQTVVAASTPKCSGACSTGYISGGLVYKSTGK